MIKAAEKVMAHEEGGPTFGHLVLLMRDVKGKATEIEELVMDDEDVSDLAEHDDKKDAKERNIIRRGLKDAFKSITVRTMQRPHADISGI